MPELQNLAVHDRRPLSLLSRANPDDRASDFNISVRGSLTRYHIFEVKDAVATHVEKYNFLSTLELDAIESTAYMVEDHLINIVAKVHDTEKVMSYCKMLLPIQEANQRVTRTAQTDEENIETFLQRCRVPLGPIIRGDWRVETRILYSSHAQSSRTRMLLYGPQSSVTLSLYYY
ncbi:uncharacterized protein MELLADRAFT_107408 [Melampsora larici-populina 98AG31]|uniref:Uncharacterized protein n=1 Tax=Melampsora larici-populina (strain 98AG31 / pathotype 3-4-7) TaxID=747676 RepID=F4RPP8_MELLP|nr:uncharacterized protein MELLADRAFT_107408 [Melampsora larici-populina 98AG31]EGG05578.1 hypothetical protein MELLADRAFT_107408 [Melampsora larici-populina 98AG31]